MSYTESAPVLLSMRGIQKSFPGVCALSGVDLTLHGGEVLALMGENGAGKSTLIKVLAGAHLPDAGTIELAGKAVRFRTPHESQRAGIAVIYQEFNLIPGLSARENIFLGQERSRAGFVSRSRERAVAAELFQRLGLTIDPETVCRRLTIAQQQGVEIAKALVLDARILVMDEPTAALTPPEVDRLFQIIGDLKSRGLGIVYISHRLDEVFKIADTITVLRDGANVGGSAARDMTRGALIELMVGRKLQDEFPPRVPAVGEPRLVVEDLRRGQAVRGVSLSVRRGEVLALTGLVGSGRTETVRLIFGADEREAGQIHLDGRRLTIRSPRDAIRNGIGLLPEDRKTQGLVLAQSARDNFGLPNLPWLSRWGFVALRRESNAFGTYRDQLKIRLPNEAQRVRNLSGGNQQKIVLAKWLARRCEVLIFDEPTRGVDVGAKYEIYLLINQLVAEGKAVLMISSELPEVLGLADRILVMHEGRITGEISDARTGTQQDIMALAIR